MKTISVRTSFVSITEPYGWVELENVELLFDGRYYHARGTVVDSLWCGALVCGVPMVKTQPKHNPGETVTVYYITPESFARGSHTRVAM